MRFSRMLFGLPFACLALVCALTFAVPMRYFDHPAGLSEVAYHLPDLTLPTVFVDKVAIVTERSTIAAPADAHRVAYDIQNQPLSAWRVAVDAYSRIDPDIRSA